MVKLSNPGSGTTLTHSLSQCICVYSTLNLMENLHGRMLIVALMHLVSAKPGK